MPGKYSKYRGNLPAFQLDQSYQTRVNAEKSNFTHLDSNEALAKQMVKEKHLKDSYEDRLKQVNCRIEALSQLIVDRFETDCTEKVLLRGGVSVGLYDGIYPSVESKEILFDWIDKEGMDDLYSVHYQTLKGLCGELLSNGQAAPPGVKVFIKTQARVREPGGSGGQEE
jgi:hypothetical protein